MMNKRMRKKNRSKKELYHFTDNQLISLQVNIASYIKCGVEELLKRIKLQCCPLNLVEDNDEFFDEYLYTKYKSLYQNSKYDKIQKWNIILLRIYWSFEQVSTWFSDSPIEIYQKYHEIREPWNKLNIEDISELDKIYHKYIQNGLNLFAKYMTNIGD